MSIPPNAPPRLTEQLAAELRARAADFGLAVTARCQHCGAPIFAARSLAHRAGPVCRRRHKKSDTGNPAKSSPDAAHITSSL